MSGASRTALAQTLDESCEALSSRHHQYFAKALGMRESWRCWKEFRGSCVYVDIETDGSQGSSGITCIGLYDGSAFRCLVKDEDLAYFPDIVSHYGMIVTFFGTGFDIPILQRAFPSFHFDHIHLDLCHAFKRLGIRGGLKRIERQFGIERGSETSGLNGRDAVRLWRQYLRGDDASLETLVAYNQDDVVNMERLAEIAFNQLEHATLNEAGVGHLLERAQSLV